MRRAGVEPAAGLSRRAHCSAKGRAGIRSGDPFNPAAWLPMLLTHTRCRRNQTVSAVAWTATPPPRIRLSKSGRVARCVGGMRDPARRTHPGERLIPKCRPRTAQSASDLLWHVAISAGIHPVASILRLSRAVTMMIASSAVELTPAAYSTNSKAGGGTRTHNRQSCGLTLDLATRHGAA